MISVHSLDHIITVHVYGFICNKFRILLYYIYINLYHFIRCKYHILLSLTSTYLSSLKLVVIVSSLISYDNSCDRKSTETDMVEWSLNGLFWGSRNGLVVPIATKGIKVWQFVDPSISYNIKFLIMSADSAVSIKPKYNWPLELLDILVN